MLQNLKDIKKSMILFSILAGLLELIGIWLVGKKKRIGFIFSIIGCVLWIFVSVFSLPAVGLLLVVVPAIVVNTKNYVTWKNNHV